MANNFNNAGNARAGAYLNQGNALNSAIGQYSGMYGAGMFGSPTGAGGIGGTGTFGGYGGGYSAGGQPWNPTGGWGGP